MGLDPTVICGAAPLGKLSGGRAGAGEWLIAEACEYRENFRHLGPQIAVLLGIEPDHFDYFQSPAELETAFRRFVERLPADGMLVTNVDRAVTRRVMAAARCAVVTYGCAADADWQATQIKHIHGRYSFALRHDGQLIGQVLLQVPGRHQVENALAAAAASHAAGARP